MKKTFMAIVLGTILLPGVVFSHDGRSRQDYAVWRHNSGPVARRGDPGYYCHKHERKLHPDDKRRHCHSSYNDPHGAVRGRDFRHPWWRR